MRRPSAVVPPSLLCGCTAPRQSQSITAHRRAPPLSRLFPQLYSDGDECLRPESSSTYVPYQTLLRFECNISRGGDVVVRDESADPCTPRLLVQTPRLW